jgi:hypothetical protein
MQVNGKENYFKMDFNFCGLINWLVSFEIWCWRSMEKISWSDRVRNGEVLQRVKEERNIIQTVKRRKCN